MTLDFDARQFTLFLRLLGTLGSRRELATQFGFDQHAVMLSGAFGMLIGGFIGLAALGHPPVRGYLMASLGISAFWLLPRLVSQAADAFLNPSEASVLAHRPVHAGSYLAAKAVYVLRAALITTVPLNLIPAAAGLLLPQTKWFYPITHLVAVVAGTVFTAFVVAGIFGVIVRVLPLGRVRSAALWFQLLAVSAVPVAPQLARAFRLPFDLDARAWSALPVTWFAWLGLAGHDARPMLDLRLAIPGAALSLALVAFGLRALIQNYLAGIATAARLAHPRRSRLLRFRGMSLTPARLVPGGQPARGGTRFVGTLARRDWQFRRMFSGGGTGIVVLFAIGVGRRFAHSPFEPGAPLNAVHFVPLMSGMLLLQASLASAYTDRPRARWIFHLMPASGLRGVVRGTYWGLWWPLVAFPHALLTVAAAWFWGAADALVFFTYSLALSSLYLGAGLWLADGLPFTRPADPNRGRGLIGVMLVYLAAGAAIVALQRYVLFPRIGLVLTATVVLTMAAAVAASMSFRILERRVVDTLTAGEDTGRMFQQVVDAP